LDSLNPTIQVPIRDFLNPMQQANHLTAFLFEIKAIFSMFRFYTNRKSQNMEEIRMYISPVRVSPSFAGYKECMKYDSITLLRKGIQKEEKLKDIADAIRDRLADSNTDIIEKGMLEGVKKQLGIKD